VWQERNGFRAGIERAVMLGWLWKHESGTSSCTAVPRCLPDEGANEQAKAQMED
jgi:hypothetical protein